MSATPTDINGKDGPYWAAYQDHRKANGVMHNPDYVPDWFLSKIARARVSAARVELEQLNSENARQAFQALRRFENFLMGGANVDEELAIVWGLLGGQEVQTKRENEEFEAELLREAQHREARDTGVRHDLDDVLRETGIDPESVGQVGCPDGAKCHHGCRPGPCFRVQTGGPLSGRYQDDLWPTAVLAEEGVAKP